jgi:anti-sigma regulatory factor (Ser/Thr protein kinase)
MPSNTAIEVITPVGSGINGVPLFQDTVVVLADNAGILVEMGRIFHSSVRLVSLLGRNISPSERRVEIPVIGRDGEISGVLCRDFPLTGVSSSCALTRDDDIPIIDVTAKATLHDIANLLATIDCGLRLLERQTEVEGRQLIIERMRHAVQRGALSSRKLLGGDFIQRNGHSGITSRRDLAAAVEDLRHAVGPGRSVHTEIAEDLSAFAADPEDLYFALLNLCRNANAALHDGGEVVISAKNTLPRPGALTGAVEIIVADNGSGMTDDVLERAFDTNFTTKPLGQGSGLGLGQVLQFVQESGGAMEIESEPGMGTAVRMMLLPVLRRVDGDRVDLSAYLNGSENKGGATNFLQPRGPLYPKMLTFIGPESQAMGLDEQRNGGSFLAVPTDKMQEAANYYDVVHLG